MTTESTGSGKGKAFFDRADQVAETANWDFAIELYLEGIQREPENLERGHKPLRDVAMKRKFQGGKDPGKLEQLKRRHGKDPLTNLVNAEYLLAKKPGSVEYMERTLKAAQELDLPAVCKWICDILLEAQRQAEKPNRRVLMTLTDAYDRLEEYGPAIEVCQIAQKVTPEDHALEERLTELQTKQTIAQGKYDQEGGFSKGVRNMDKQVELAQKDQLSQSSRFIEQQLERARGEYAADPTVPGKINALVDALLKFEDESYENEAIDILDKAYRDTGQYQFKMRIGDIKIRQMKRRFNKLLSAGDKEAAREQARAQLAFELEEYAERAANYPTDLSMKYELGRRQLMAGEYDQAIASLQQAQRDPRRHVLALNYLGQAFARKKWFSEAVETYQRALNSEMTEERTKEIRYNLADCLEKMAEGESDPDERRRLLREAQEQLSDVAQIDITYKDTRDRLEATRKKLSAG